MELTHEFTVPADLDQTWAAFDDIESVAECFPGAKVTSVEGDTFIGSVKVKLGPIVMVYNGTGTFVEKDEAAHRMVIEAKGKDKRGNGTAGADVVATMTDAGAGSTRVEVHTDLAITGKPAQFGRGIIEDVSNQLLGKFTDCLEQKVGAGEGEQDAEPAAVPSGADAGTPGTPSPATSPMPTTPEEASAEADATTQRAKAAHEAAPSASPTTRPQPVSGSSEDHGDALDLGATVLPVLLKSYWRQALAVVLALLVLRRLLRR